MNECNRRPAMRRLLAASGFLCFVWGTPSNGSPVEESFAAAKPGKPGEHEAVLEFRIWDTVQHILLRNGPRNLSRSPRRLDN